jgi:hypothetical protein
MVLFSGLASLLKLVISVCLNSGLCEYPTYRLTLLVSVASVPTPYFDPVGFYVNYDERLEHLCLVLEKPSVVGLLAITSLSLLRGKCYTV